MEGSSLQMECRANYRIVNIPRVFTRQNSNNIYAFAFNNVQVNGENPYLNAVRAMKKKAGKEYEQKYSNTEKFIRLHGA